MVTFSGFEVLQHPLKFCSHKDLDLLEKTKQDIQASRLYLKTDYKLHLSTSDQCADHCIPYALSDPMDPQLQNICDHEHTLILQQMCTFPKLSQHS